MNKCLRAAIDIKDYNHNSLGIYKYKPVKSVD